MSDEQETEAIVGTFKHSAEAVALLGELARCVAERLGMPSGPEPWVGVPQAAAHLSCKPQRIYDLVHRQDETRIPHRKEGGRLLFKLSELDRWVEHGHAR